MSQGKPVKITAAKIEAMEVGEQMWDAIVTGLHIRYRGRNKPFHFAYSTLQGKRRNPVIGRYGIEMKSIDQARETAQAWSLEIAKGGDPAIKKIELRTGFTLNDLKERWDKEIVIAKERREAEDTLIRSNDLENLQIIKKQRTALTDLSKRTITDYEQRWGFILRHFKEDRVLASISDEEVQAMHDELTKKVKDTKSGITRGGHFTANRMVIFFCTLLNHAKEWKMLDSVRVSPRKAVSLYVERGRERPMTEDEIKKFLKTAAVWLQSEDQTQKNTVRLASLCLVCGTRSGEFKTSRLSWINWEVKTMTVPKAKGDTWKTIPLGDVALFILKDRLAEWEAAGAHPAQDWIIPSEDGMTYMKECRKSWISFLKAAGIPHSGKKTKLNLHDLRHTFITRMVSSGSGTQDQAGKIVGHKNRETTDGYSHLMIESSIKAIDKTFQDFGTLLEHNTPPAPVAQMGLMMSF